MAAAPVLAARRFYEDAALRVQAEVEHTGRVMVVTRSQFWHAFERYKDALLATPCSMLDAEGRLLQRLLLIERGEHDLAAAHVCLDLADALGKMPPGS